MKEFENFDAGNNFYNASEKIGFESESQCYIYIYIYIYNIIVYTYRGRVSEMSL